MKDYNLLESFGEVLSAIISDRGIGSDELLARKAMRVQDRQTKRINIQRKTINNWRNNRSRPRSVSDRQFQLVLAALEVNEQELSALVQFLESPSEKKDGLEDDNNITQSGRLLWVTIGAACILMIVVFLNFVQLSSYKPSNTFLTEIPRSELTLSESGYIIPNSDTKPVTIEQMEKLSGWDLYVARNEIFARRGWEFTRASSICLQNHFNNLSKSNENPVGWYQRLPQKDEPSNIENSNAETIRIYECSERGGQFKCNGRLNQCE